MVAAAVIGGAVIGAAGSAYAGSKAAGAQRDAAQTASNTQLQMYGQTRTDQAPWRQAGGSAVGALASYYGLPGANGQTPDPTQTAANDTKLIQSLPGYQFNFQQGNQAVQRDLAAKGLLDSGAAGKALTQYGQGYAMNASNQYIGGLQSLAGLGQTSAAQTGQIGAYTGAQVGSNQIYAGNAQASGYANQANAINSGLQGLVGSYGQYNQQQNLQNYYQGSPGYYAANSPTGGYGGYNPLTGSGGGGTFNQGGYEMVLNP
jgi:hypothetical protein